MKKKTRGPKPTPPAPNDLDTIYSVPLTGQEIDTIGNIFDQVIRASGIQGSLVVMPLLEKIVAPRKAALAAKSS